MIEKDKNKWGSENALLSHKSRLKTKSKILALGLMSIIVLVGLFGPVEKTLAGTVTCGPKIVNPEDFGKELKKSIPEPPGNTDYARKFCEDDGRTYVSWEPEQTNETKEKTAFSKVVSETECGLGGWITGGSLAGCLLQFVYYTFYMLGSFLLWLSALLFNFSLDYTLNSELLRSDFIASSWGIVRDLSNIFFILILLYIAIKIILDFGGSEAKRMIGKVLIIALLINFSMFFTQVIIDSSNILALIFYNKIKPETEIAGEPNKPATDPNNKKDLAGGLTKSFNPATHLDKTFFERAGDEIILNGKPTEKSVVSIGVLIGITVISGFIMLFAAYALFISSLSFLGRLIELFILIIFSPFAFISSTTPLLKNAEYLGWDKWFSRLLKVAFMAPIFMFFLYFIFLLLGKGGTMFSNAVKSDGFWADLLNLAIPALIILILLMKATKFAKEGSGAIGEAAIKAGSLALGVAGGVALGALAKGGQATVGKYSEKIAQSETAKRWVKEGKFGADSLQRATGFLGGRDFDLRKGMVGGFLKSAEGVTGLNFGSASKFLLKPGGGYRGDRERAEKKRQERAERLKVSEDEPLQQDLNKAEGQFYEMNNASSHEIEQIETRRKGARENLTDYEQNQKAARGDRETAKDNLEQNQKAARDDRETAKDNLGNNTVGTPEEKEYDKKKAAFDAIVASGIANTDPTYIAAETEKNTAATAVSAINPAYVAAKDAYDAAVNIINKEKEYDKKKAALDNLIASGAAVTDPAYVTAEAEKNTAAVAVSAINPAYVAAKDAYDAAEKNFKEVNKEYEKRAENVRSLTEHRSTIKNTKGTADNFDDTNADSAVSKARQAALDFADVIARGIAKTDQEYKGAEEADKRATEILHAAEASRDYGKQLDGTFASINDFEDKILPKLREKIEDENRKRFINYAKGNIRGSDNRVINALRTTFTTPAGDDQASRNAAAHKIIEGVSKKKI